MLKVIARLVMMDITYLDIVLDAPLVPINVKDVALIIIAQSVMIIIN